MFLNGRAKKVEMKKVNQAALSKVWNEERVKTRQSVDYIGFLQPERELGPRVGEDMIYSKTEPLYEVEVMSLEDVSYLLLAIIDFLFIICSFYCSYFLFTCQ